MTTELSDTATETPDEVLKRLERMVRRAGEFALGFVRCNSPLQCSQMSAALKEPLSDLRFLEITLDEPIISLLDRIEEQWDTAHPPNLVCVYGLEKSINPDRDYSPVLGRLNHDRDLIRKAIPVPLLIWLPDFALDCLVRGAPDFWAWRSGVYEFPTNAMLWQQDSLDATAYKPLTLATLSEQDKRTEIARLQEVARTAQSIPHQGQREQSILARLLNRLGILHQSLGEVAMARRLYEQSLDLAHKIGDKASIAVAFNQLGMLQHNQGHLEEAQSLYIQSFQLAKNFELVNYLGGIANNLAAVQQRCGNLGDALQLYESSLQFSDAVGDTATHAMTLHQLGTLRQQQGKLDEARQLYDRSLQLAQEIHNRSGIASTLHQLATLEHNRGNLVEAERLYQQSLSIERELGNKSGIADSLAQIGQLQWDLGNAREAQRHLASSLMMLTELKSSYADPLRQYIRQLRQSVGDERFKEWLVADFGKEAEQILKIMDESPAGTS